ncbi:uncharacterized protein LOC123448458 isoform X2 [Hordeum vulgare subsp. vulgare]|uniref:uncharacterized protein LOC123448458 isoform X2 n=1 Tax=Hordeum vulgare subsp. vulgare TaxID=112509 RepID=UPI001D1A3F02|nr:uncharacterized protein LOC123448458 isoform X2 [Hordeum vulgare subsp. vulgare]
MSHPGKFVSVNLNRSYGQSAQFQSGGRPSRPAAPSAGGGGGMVVLSRGRGSSSMAKPQQPKLSVPPPLNLPSLRKEHERFEGATATTGGGVASAPPRSGGAVAGWTKPAPASEKQLGSIPAPSGVARLPSYGFQEKAVVLRGEDFPSLKAAVAPPPAPPVQHRQKDVDGAQAAMPETQPMPLGMRPHVMPSRGAEPLASAGVTGTGLHGSAEKAQTHDLGPLPLVRLRYDADWADDERDTGLSLPDRDSKERGFGRIETMVPGCDFYGATMERLKNESLGRDYIAPNKEGVQDGLWRSPMPSHNVERTDGRPHSAGKGSGQLLYHEGITNGASKDLCNTSKEPAVRAYGQIGTELHGSAHIGETAGECYNDNSNNWYRGKSFQNNPVSKVMPYLGNKGPLVNEPGAKFGRDKWLTGVPVRPLVEHTGFDSISAVSFSSIKKKKETTKPSDFHDPVRESFEAELDRILRVQEQERQRVVEEQARVREIARKQDEERENLIREEEERRRLVEEEARQAVWQAEQETLEASRRVEEQRIAREEEKMRVAMEEERRREAARQKLLELEARIARRRAESNMSNGNLTSAANDEQRLGALKDRDVSRYTNAGERHAISRLGERINTSISSVASSLNRYSDTVPRALNIMGDGHSGLVDREHAYHSARAAFEDQENIHYSPRRGTLGTKRESFPKKDSYVGFRASSVGPSSRDQINDSPWALEDYSQGRVSRWDAPTENNCFDKQSEFDTHFFNSDRFGDAAWLPSGSYRSPNAQQGGRMFQNSEAHDFSSSTKSCYPMRHPCVPPPHVVTSMHGSAVSSSIQRANSSFIHDLMRESSSRDDEQTMHSQYGSAYQEVSRQHRTPAEGIVVNEQQNGDRASPVLGSQSSLSVSSPPRSPEHVSHDEMDVSCDSPALPTSADGDRTVVSDNDQVASTLDAANISRITTSSAAYHMEDEEWPSEHNESKRKQDEYDEEGNSYQEDEINDGEGDTLDLANEFTDVHLDLDDEFADEDNTTAEMEPVILGFDQGVQVEIPVNNELELSSVKSTELEVGVHLGVVKQELRCGSVDPYDIVTLQGLDQTNALADESNVDPSGSTAVSSSKLPQASFAPPIDSSTSAVIDQNEVPVSLGLFSGPSLIPTPIRAIQIGSIQMPIHLHNQINPSLAQLLPSSAPLFKFGQLRHVRPVAQNVRQHSQAVPSIQPPAPTLHISKQNGSSGIPNEMDRNANQITPRESNLHQRNESEINWMADLNEFQSRLDRTSIGENASFRLSKGDSQRNNDISSKRNHKSSFSNTESSQVGSYGKALSGIKAPGAVSGGSGRRYDYAVKESNMGSTGSPVEPFHKDSRGFQRRSRRNIRRTEFRVRANVEKNETQASECHDEQNENPVPNGLAREIPVRNVNRKEGTNETIDINGADSSSTSAHYYSKTERLAQKAPSYDRSRCGYKKSRAGGIPEGDANTLLRAGVVRIVKQQGFEMPVDADGFIEVRSKKQIMSVRREQREKENRLKIRTAKAPRKQHQMSLHSSNSSSICKGTVSLDGEPAKKVSLGSVLAVEGRVLDHAEPSSSFMNDTASMTPIGRPPSANTGPRTNYCAMKPIGSQSTSDLITSIAATKLAACFSESNNKTSPIGTPFNMGNWDSSQTNQQVMPLTQTQLEEAMKPEKFEQAGSGFPLESNNALSPTVTTDVAYTSSASPINSLLAGEKIQFVTSPTVLAPITRTISNGLGAPGSSWPEMKIDRNLPGDSSAAAVLFDKEKATTKDQCQDSEEAEAQAEAEAAASAVAVAAICTDEAVGTAASASDKNSFSSKDLTGLTAGGAITGQPGQSSREEPLTVALPADLSVDTPSMSLWPSLPSLQVSGPTLCQFPIAQTSHFSCFEMNTMLGAHPFAFGPSDESAGTLGQQPQRSNALPSAQLGAWPSMVDSFYRPPTGFAGPFISPGGIPGVQGPPHMVVYNHFAPLGQFGQMGLGFMGATYISGDKQPDWKQNEGPSVGISQSDPNNQNVLPGQVTSPSFPTQVSHLRATSIMPIPTPLTMFDMASFQSSAKIQVQPCWPRVPMHSVPLSVQLQQHPIDGTAVSQYVDNVTIDKSGTNDRFQEFSASDSNKSFPNTAASQSSDVKQPVSSSSDARTVEPSFVRIGVIGNEVPNSNPKPGQVAKIPSKPHQSSLPSDQQFKHPVNNNQDRPARVTQRTGTVNEWQRRSGYPGRSSGSDKKYGTGRMKQIYVAKSSSSSHAPSG